MVSHASTSDESGDRLSPSLLRVAVVAGFGALLLNLGMTTFNVALDAAMRDLHTTLPVAQWAITGYLLTLTLVLPTFRWMTERVGVKRLYIASLVGFVVASALCAFSWSIETLIVFRMIQGAVGGLLTPIAQALTAQHASAKQMGRVLSIVAIPVLVAPLLGPVVAGALVESFSWRSIFLVNVPFGILGALACARYLPRDAESAAQRSRLDLGGLALLSPGLALVIYGISSLRRGHESGALSSTLLPLAMAAALLVAFVTHARRRPETALLDLRLFGRRVVGAALATYVLASMASFGGQLLLPLYYQQVRGQTAAGAGLLLAPQGIGMLLTLPRIGKLTDRYDPGKLVIGGVLLTLLGTLVFMHASTTTSPWLLGLSLVVRGAGLGATNNPALATVYRQLPKSEVANATTALNVVQRMGAPLGTAIMAVVLAWRVSACPSVASAFAQTFAVSIALTALTLVPASFLVNPRRSS